MEDSVCQVRYNNICDAKQKRTEQQGRAERHGMSRHVTANGLGRLCSASGNVCILDKQMRYTRNLFQSASSMFGQAHKPPSLYQNYQILIMLPLRDPPPPCNSSVLTLPTSGSILLR